MQTRPKFTFDTEFLPHGERRSEGAERRRKVSMSMDEIAAVKAEGHAEGENAAAARHAEAMERALAALALAVQGAAHQIHADVENVRAEAAQVALAAARKLAGAALAAVPDGEVEAALRAAMHQAVGEPRLVLRATPELAARIEPRLPEIAHEEGFDGRVSVSADPHFKGADCRVEWRGGGAERSFEAIETALADLIERRFSELSLRLKG